MQYVKCEQNPLL